MEDETLDPLDQSYLDQTSRECISFEQNDSMTTDENSNKNQFQPNVLRSSRRRIQKHSAVVLNSDRLRAIQGQDLSINKSEIAETLNNISLNTNITTSANNNINTYINTNNNSEESTQFTSLTRKLKAVQIIIKTFRLFQWKRMNKFTQFGQWNEFLAMKIFSIYLGYRVRKVLRDPEILKLIDSQKDIFRVLLELILPHQTQLTITQLEQFSLLELKQLLLSSPSLSGIDHTFADSLIKQILQERQKLIEQLFSCKFHWISFPKPGYWEINISTILKRTKIMKFNSPARAKKQQAIQETPPHVKQAMTRATSHRLLNANKKGIQKFHFPNDFAMIDGDSQALRDPEDSSNQTNTSSPPQQTSQQQSIPMKSKSLQALLAQKEMRPQTAPQPTTTHQQNISPEALHSRRQSTRNSLLSSELDLRPKTTQANQHSPSSLKKRSLDGPHIQLDILSAEKLMPARKGGNTNNPDLLPDRKPCLKISLFLPTKDSISSSSSKNITANASSVSSSSVAASNLKRSIHMVRDFDIATFNPRWDTSFTLPLTLNKSILLTYLEQHPEILPHSNTSDDISEELNSTSIKLTDSQYEQLSRLLLSYYSLGSLLIEVTDGERFNEDIFLGQIMLLLSSFMPMIKKLHELEIKGNFPLEKAKPTNRVSGSVKLHAYLHPPEKQYLESQLELLFRTMKATKQQQQQQQQQQAHVQYHSQYSQYAQTKSKHLSVKKHENRHDFITSEEDYDDEHDFNDEDDEDEEDIETYEHGNDNEEHVSDNDFSSRKNIHSYGRRSPRLSENHHTIDPSDNDDEDPLNQAGVFVKDTARGTGLTSVPITKPSSNVSQHQQETKDTSESPFRSHFMKTLIDKNTIPNNHTNNHTNISHNVTNQSLSSPIMEESYKIQQQIKGKGYSPSTHNDRNSYISSTPERNKSPATATSSHHILSDPSNHDAGIKAKEIRKCVSVSSIVSEKSARDSSIHKRNFLSDMAKQLDGLTAVQHSAEEVYDNFHRILEAKERQQVISNTPPPSQTPQTPQPTQPSLQSRIPTPKILTPTRRISDSYKPSPTHSNISQENTNHTSHPMKIPLPPGPRRPTLPPPAPEQRRPILPTSTNSRLMEDMDVPQMEESYDMNDLDEEFESEGEDEIIVMTARPIIRPNHNNTTIEKPTQPKTFYAKDYLHHYDYENDDQVLLEDPLEDDQQYDSDYDML